MSFSVVAYNCSKRRADDIKAGCSCPDAWWRQGLVDGACPVHGSWPARLPDFIRGASR
jgi:hypothetical protein